MLSPKRNEPRLLQRYCSVDVHWSQVQTTGFIAVLSDAVDHGDIEVSADPGGPPPGRSGCDEPRRVILSFD